MTSPALVGPAPCAPRRPVRRQQVSRLRRTSQLVLLAGTAVAVAAAFGPPWLVRVGVVAAVLAAVVACLAAWRELSQTRRVHAADLLEASRAHGRALSEERTRNAAVVQALTERGRRAADLVESLRATVAGLRAELGVLAGDRAYLRGQLIQRERLVGRLRDTVRAREGELAEQRAAAAALAAAGTSQVDHEGAEVHHLPRRGQTAAQAASETTGDRSDRAPTVVDLQPKAVEHVAATDAPTPNTMVLPNYEADLRVG